VAELYDGGTLWISQTRGKQHSFELTGDAPTHLLAFLSRHREVQQQPEQDLEDLQAELEELS